MNQMPLKYLKKSLKFNQERYNMKKRVPKHTIVVGGICLLFLLSTLWILIKNINSVNKDNPIIKELYTYLGNDYLDYCNGMPFYNSTKITYDSLDDSLKMCLAYKHISSENIINDELNKNKKQDACNFTNDKQFSLDKDEKICTVETFSKKDLNNEYKKLFNKEIEEYQDFNISGNKSCYFDTKESRFVCGNSVMQNLQLGWAPTTYRMINKVKEKGNRIYIYDTYLAINNSNCYLSNNGDIENSKCSDSINKKTKFNSIFLLKHGKRYLHVFEKNNNGNYFWISSTPE